MTAIQKQRILAMRQQGLSFSEIADNLGLPKNTVKTFCWRSRSLPCDASEDTGNKENKENNEICDYCGKRLEQRLKQKPRRFCDDKCRHAWWRDNRDCLNRKAIYPVVCAHCKTEFDSYGNKSRKYCTHACYIAARFKKDGRKEVAAV